METPGYAELGPPLAEIKSYLQRAAYPVLLLAGGIGNTVSFLVMNLPSNRASVMCFYFRTLAVTDTISLVILLIPKLAVNVLPEILKNRIVGDVNCGCHFFVGVFVYNISIWQIIIVAVDRFIVVKFPMKASLWCTMKKARILVAINVVVHIVIYLPHAFLFSQKGGGNTYYTICTLPAVLQWYDLGFNVINTVADVIIPLGLLFLLNIAIILSLNKHSSDMAEKTNIHTIARSKQEKTMTVMLIVVASSLLILIFPFTIDFILWECCMDDVMTSHPGARGLSYEIGFVVCIFSNAINFFLYLISSSKFKADLRLLVCKRVVSKREI
jgi:hypothetical protein